MGEDEKKVAESTPLGGGVLDSIKRLFMNSKPVTLGQKVGELEKLAEIEEERTKLIKRGVVAKGRINKALQERGGLASTQPRRFSRTQLIIFGIMALVLIIILASVVKC